MNDEATPEPVPEAEPAPPEEGLIVCEVCKRPALAKPRLLQHLATGAQRLVWLPVCETPGCPGNPLTALRPRLEVAPAMAQLPNREQRRHPR